MTEKPAWPEKHEATQAQKTEHAAALEREEKRRPPLPVQARMKDGHVVQVRGTVTDEAIHDERLRDVCGTRSDEWVNGIVRGLINAAGGAKDADSAATLLEGLAFLNGIGPRDEVEAALAAQMFALHRASMNLARQMGAAGMRDSYRDYGNLLVKTTRTFAAQVEALAKLRNGGKQQVEVRYVYVDARGGQNVIGGDIVAGGGGRGGNHAQPHVPGLAFAPGAAVWSPDPAGDGLPATGDAGQDALLAARREEPGGAEG